MRALIDREKWSKESKQSLSYEFAGKYYDDKPYNCYKCKKPDIFTGQEQKYTYEVKQSYIWQQRLLCKECYSNFKELKSKIATYEKHWANETEATKGSANYLNEWLTCIEKVPFYGKPKNESIAIMLQKYINQSA